MEDFPNDLNSKYNKLALEFSKSRAQVSVLKRALADEQGVSNDLKNAMKEKDQITRKLEQEVESLNFRNVQLTKRIGILQEDLDKLNSKKTTKLKQSTDSNSVLSGELQSRIEENEKLHLQVSTSEMRHQEQLNELNYALDQIKLELSKQENSYSDIINKQEAMINKLNEDKAKFELRLNSSEQRLKDSLMKEESLKEEYSNVKQDLSSKLNHSTIIIKQNLLFLDANQPKLNKVNLPQFYKKDKTIVKKVLLDLKSPTLEILRRFSELHIYLGSKQEFSISDEILGKLAELLKQSSPLVKNLSKAIEDFLTYDEEQDEIIWMENLSLKDIVKAFSDYTKYLALLIPYIQLSIDNETKLKISLTRLVTAHTRLKVLAKKFNLCFSQIDSWLKFLYELELSNVVINEDKQNLMVQRLKESLANLLAIFKEIKLQLSTKFMVEHQLPTTTNKQKTNDECILASIVGLINGLELICSYVSKLVDRKVCPPYVPHPVISQFRQRGIDYMKRIRGNPSKSIPYEQAINNSTTLQEVTEVKDLLSKELEVYKNKVINLEEEKENWMLECHLMQTKMGKEETYEVADSEYKTFFRERVSGLVAQIQMADSKAMFYHAECVSLIQKLHYLEKVQDEMRKEMEECRKQHNDLQKEQHSIVKSYEEQLHMMSEHLANITEEYSNQKQELNHFKSAGKRSSK